LKCDRLSIMRYSIFPGLLIIPVLGISTAGLSQDVAPSKAAEPLVDVAKVDPTIVIDLRYATPRNVTGQPIYPQGTRCLVRSGVAEKLKVAQQYLWLRGYGLKIWDAYRPEYAQKILWDAVKNYEFAADPAKGRALHTWGVAVDVTSTWEAIRRWPCIYASSSMPCTWRVFTGFIPNGGTTWTRTGRTTKSSRRRISRPLRGVTTVSLNG